MVPVLEKNKSGDVKRGKSRSSSLQGLSLNVCGIDLHTFCESVTLIFRDILTRFWCPFLILLDRYEVCNGRIMLIFLIIMTFSVLC
jgi:hypothetical protein